jgi:hypothetical protein
LDLRGRRHDVGEGRSRRVVDRRSGVGGEVSRSPRFSALLISLRSLGFVGVLCARRTLVPVPRLPPFYCGTAREGTTAIHDRRLRSGRGSDRFPDPEITFLTWPAFCRLGRFASNWGLTISTAGASVLIKVLSFARTVTHVLSD